MSRVSRILSMAIACHIGLSTCVLAQELKFIVGTAAGGSIDTYTRVIAEHMSKSLGKSYIVESKPGSSGNISASYVASAPATGSTILVGTQGLLEINPYVFTNPRWSLDAFLPLIKGIEAPLVFVSHPSVPARTMGEFLDWIKRNDATSAYASYSSGTPSHFLGALLNERFSLKLSHIPYHGSAPQIVDLIAGHALFGFTTTQSSIPHVETGKLKALAVTSEKRFPQLPDIPTFQELGYPEFNMGVWFGLFIRKNTPPEVVKSLMTAAIAAHADPNVRSTLEAQGFFMSGLAGSAFEKSIAEGRKRWGKLVALTGFKAND